MTMKDELGRAQPVIDQLNAAIRENPLAAGLIGAGVAWMLLGSKGLGAMAGAAKATASTAATAAATGVGSAAAAAGSHAANAVKGAASAVKDAANVAKDAARDAAGAAMEPAPALVPDMPDTAKAAETMADVSAAVGERVRSAAASGRDYGAAIQSRLSENLERQPLLLGAIGLAIGAGIASTFATTAVEQEWLGKSAAAAREKAEAVADHAREVLSEVRDEAERQGLTVDAVKDAAASVAGKVKTVAETARDSATKDFGSRS